MTDEAAELKALLASQAELVGSISHDLKGLLSGIDGGIYLVDSGLKKDNKARVDQGFEMVKRNLSRIRRTVANTLYFVKDREIDWQPLELSKVASSLEKMFRETAEQLQVTLSVVAGAGSFEAGELPVQSLLVNLIDFALHTCHAAKLVSSPSVALSIALEGDQAVFSLKVLGCNVEPETAAFALKPFYAPKGADRSHLPLFIANRLTRALGGTLAIDSPGNNETRLLVSLPAKAGGRQA